jgi:hypothetical protein
MRKELKSISNSGDSSSKKDKWCYGGAHGGVWQILSGGSPEWGGRFCVGALDRNVASVAFNLVVNEFYKFHAFSVTSKDNATINCITMYPI